MLTTPALTDIKLGIMSRPPRVEFTGPISEFVDQNKIPWVCNGCHDFQSRKGEPYFQTLKRFAIHNREVHNTRASLIPGNKARSFTYGPTL